MGAGILGKACNNIAAPLRPCSSGQSLCHNGEGKGSVPRSKILADEILDALRTGYS